MTGLKRISALLLCIGLIGTGLVAPSTNNVWAKGDLCQGMPSVNVRVDILPADPIAFDLEKSISELTRLSDEAAERSGDHKGPALGFYQASAGFKYSVKASGQDLGADGVCLVLKSIEVHFGIKERKILVAREIADKPCIRDFVVAHEQRHVAIDEAILRLYLAQLQAELSLELSGGLGIAAKTPADAKQVLKTTLESRMQEATKKFSARRADAQLKLHDGSEEEALESACGPGIRSLLHLQK